LLRVDYLVVGAGLTGAVVARCLADQGLEVLVLERRPFVGGNAADAVHESGIPYHRFGPHFFRTSSAAIWRFARRFSHFRPYQAEIRSWVDGRHENWPVSGSYVRRALGGPWSPPAQDQRRAAANFEEACLAMMPRPVYEKFVKGYSEKQWGVAPRELDARLAGRFEVRWDDDPRLVKSRHQGLPVAGYTAWVERMLEGVPVRTGVDYLVQQAEFAARRLLVYTGPIDAWFGHELGRLAWRGQRREHEWREGVDLALPAVVVNNPGLAAGAHVRTIEWKHLLPARERAGIRGTLLTREVPITPSHADGCEYPFQDAKSRVLYRRYRARAEARADLLVCGRLGEYRYYDMDQAIARARVLAGRILRRAGLRPPAARVSAPAAPSSASPRGAGA
jgi:UDP-galactopyranose mutase